MSERTKGPWHTGLDRNPKRPGYVLSGGEIIVDCEFPEDEAEGIANAAAIVLWENHFDELEKALEDAQVALAGKGEYRDIHIRATNAEKIIIEALIKVKTICREK
jgi:hypothetical protein